MNPRFPIEDDALCAAVVSALEKRTAEIMYRIETLKLGLVPTIVIQSQDDNTLPPAARSVMWHLRLLLVDFEYREVKTKSIAFSSGVKETTAGQMLHVLVRRGYLDESGKKKPRAFRLPQVRRTSNARAA